MIQDTLFKTRLLRSLYILNIIVLLHLLLYFCTAPPSPCNGRPTTYRDDDNDDDDADDD